MTNKNKMALITTRSTWTGWNMAPDSEASTTYNPVAYEVSKDLVIVLKDNAYQYELKIVDVGNDFVSLEIKDSELNLKQGEEKYFQKNGDIKKYSLNILKSPTVEVKTPSLDGGTLWKIQLIKSKI